MGLAMREPSARFGSAPHLDKSIPLPGQFPYKRKELHSVDQGEAYQRHLINPPTGSAVAAMMVNQGSDARLGSSGRKVL